MISDTDNSKALDKEITVVQNENILSQGNDVYQFKNYHFLDSRSLSKSRLKKMRKRIARISRNTIYNY